MLILSILIVAQDATAQFLEQCPSWSMSSTECPYLYEYEGYNIFIARTVEAAYEVDPNLALSHFDNFIAGFDSLFVPGRMYDSPADLRLDWDQPDIYLIWGGKPDPHAPCETYEFEHGPGGLYCMVPNSIVLNLKYSWAPATAREILLHEFIHLIHFLVLPGGFRNTCVIDLYNQMYDSRKTRHWMRNQLEFFAEVAGAYYSSPSDAYIASGREDLKKKFPILYDMIYYMVDHLDEYWNLVNEHCKPEVA